MSEQEKADLNRRVAVALGYDVLKDPYTAWGYYLNPPRVNPSCTRFEVKSTPEAAWKYCPKFCTDPAAADLIETWFESEEWRLIQDFVPVCGGGKFWLIRAFKQDSIGKIEEGSGISRKHALCLAFLAAHDAQKDVERGSDEGTTTP